MNTAYDFTHNGGRPLDSHYLDDCFVDIQRDEDQNINAELYDPESNYGLNVTANHVVNAMQLYAPVDKPFVAIEPQMNFPDPFNKSIWSEKNTGIKMLKENEEMDYTVKINLFQK